MNRRKALLIAVGMLLWAAACSSLATETGPPPAAEPVFPPEIHLEPLVDAGTKITHLAHAGDGSGRLFLVERAGRIRIIENGRLRRQPFLDIVDLVDSASIEQGLLSVAFDPDFAQNGTFYVNHTNLPTEDDTVIARYTVGANPNRADPDSRRQIFFLEQPANNHNGGLLLFGPDGYLYAGLGDGGRGNDPWDNAENLDVLYGKILRLDVRGQETYAIPPDNPFAGEEGARPEIWAYGFRNPWRFSFDPLTGDLYIGDVGEREWEELSFEPGGSPGGSHFGWNTLEGSQCFEPPSNCDREGKVMPIYEYRHGPDGCSITAGHVYRGRSYPELAGTFFFSDFCTGDIWGARRDPAGQWQFEKLLDTDLAVVSFGLDESGELYVLDLEGEVFRLLGGPPG